MSTMNETFGDGNISVNEILNRKRNLAQSADDLEVADAIWQKIVEKFIAFLDSNWSGLVMSVLY